MKFVVVFHYMDGEKFELEVHPNDMEDFMKAIGKSEVYFNESRGIGIWIPIEKVRYFHVEKIDGQGRRVIESNPRVSGESARNKSAVSTGNEKSMDESLSVD